MVPEVVAVELAEEVLLAHLHLLPYTEKAMLKEKLVVTGMG
tara:strand:+ start:1558 stop:1680 length:123 start_codon:yes stop_codon:yes gene_type:complete